MILYQQVLKGRMFVKPDYIPQTSLFCTLSSFLTNALLRMKELPHWNHLLLFIPRRPQGVFGTEIGVSWEDQRLCGLGE